MRRRNLKQEERFSKVENLQAQIRYFQSVKRDFSDRRDILDRQLKPLLDQVARLGADFARADDEIARLKLELGGAHLEAHNGSKIDKLRRMLDSEKKLDEVVPKELQDEQG